MRPFLVGIACSVLLAGCTRSPSGGTAGRGDADSTHIADSVARTAPLVPGDALSYEEHQGGVLYDKYCQVCHGKEGKGDGFNAFNLDPRPRDFTDSTYMGALSDEQIIQTITGGGRSVNKSVLMPAYGWTLSRQQIAYVTAYVRQFRGSPIP
jgi:mono/diheme cytochrome c family protein